MPWRGVRLRIEELVGDLITARCLADHEEISSTSTAVKYNASSSEIGLIVTKLDFVL